MSLPVINELLRLRPGLKLTIRSGHAREWFSVRVEGDFEHQGEPDFGMAMVNALHVDQRESFAHYQEEYARWDDHVSAAAERLDALRPTLLVSNVPYLSVEAAARTRTRALVYSSLNWADVFGAYCSHFPGAECIRSRLAEAYESAEAFIRPTPYMCMPSISKGLEVGPVARVGADRGFELRQRLGIDETTFIVLLSMGGIGTPIDYSAWPEVDNVHVVLGSDEPAIGLGLTSWVDTGLSYIDLVRSCDVLLTKPGYGHFVEAACNGTPVLCAPRENWPETGPQLKWLTRNGRIEFVTELELRSGHWREKIPGLLRRRAPAAPSPVGITETCDLILAELDSSH